MHELVEQFSDFQEWLEKAGPFITPFHHGNASSTPLCHASTF